MKEIKITKIAQNISVTHSAVSQWFSGKTRPKFEHMKTMSEQYQIPFSAWEDIKSYIKTIPNPQAENKVCKEKE